MTADPSPVFYLRCCCFLFFWNSILDSLCDDNKQCGLILSSCLDILTTFYPTVEFLYQLDICHLGSNIDTYVTFNNEASYHYHEVYFSFLKSFLLHLHLPLVLLSTLCVFRHDIDMRNSVKTRPPRCRITLFSATSHTMPCVMTAWGSSTVSIYCTAQIRVQSRQHWIQTHRDPQSTDCSNSHAELYRCSRGTSDI